MHWSLMIPRARGAILVPASGPEGASVHTDIAAIRQLWTLKLRKSYAGVALHRTRTGAGNIVPMTRSVSHAASAMHSSFLEKRWLLGPTK